MPDRNPESTLFNCEVSRYRSESTNQDYLISVGLPSSYAGSQTRYPVLYVLDSNVLFGAILQLSRVLSWGNCIPETIVVGIGYEIHEMKQWAALREADMKPVELQTDARQLAGAANFLKFLQTELIAQTDMKYRTVPEDRAIWGHSSGGFFVLYALLHHPELFQRYCAGSPDDYKEYYEYELQLSQRSTELPVTLTAVIGGLETEVLSATKAFFATLRERDYKGLRLSLVDIEGESHLSVIPHVIDRGLRSIYA